MTKLTLREVRTIVAALTHYQALPPEVRTDYAHVDEVEPLTDAQLNRLRERIAKATSINLS